MENVCVIGTDSFGPVRFSSTTRVVGLVNDTIHCPTCRCAILKGMWFQNTQGVEIAMKCPVCKAFWQEKGRFM
jgi:hypothetical protein